MGADDGLNAGSSLPYSSGIRECACFLARVSLLSRDPSITYNLRLSERDIVRATTRVEVIIVRMSHLLD